MWANKLKDYGLKYVIDRLADEGFEEFTFNQLHNHCLEGATTLHKMVHVLVEQGKLKKNIYRYAGGQVSLVTYSITEGYYE